jgi:hypothetical protein
MPGERLLRRWSLAGGKQQRQQDCTGETVFHPEMPSFIGLTQYSWLRAC